MKNLRITVEVDGDTIGDLSRTLKHIASQVVSGEREGVENDETNALYEFHVYELEAD